MNPWSLSVSKQWVFSLIAFILVSLGQPAWLQWSGLIAAAGGYALFWRVLLAHPSYKQRFWIASAWFFGVQLVQLSWFISHPYLYIYFVYISLSLAVALQFGVLALLIKPKVLLKVRTLLGIAALWTIFEWSRLFFLAGYSWNPVGLALTSNLYALQTASIWGVFGLSFWVILVNLFALRACIQPESNKRLAGFMIWFALLMAPYLYGAIHLKMHSKSTETLNTAGFNALLVQSAFPTEESDQTSEKKNPVDQVVDEWRQILQTIKHHHGQAIDLIVLPEFVVPFGTYTCVFPLNSVVQIFSDEFGSESVKTLPPLNALFSSIQKTSEGPQLFVDNAFWVQGIANFFNSDVLVGLEDVEDIDNKREYYSAALFFHPQMTENEYLPLERYEKRVLVPMGEYIPFEFCKQLAANYGICSSFTHGKEAKVLWSKDVPLSPSICYEETFGDLIREGPLKGAKLLVNMTNDAWYPNSSLARQHFYHSRLRSVENGVPLIRACNTGITAAIDSFGRTIAVLGGSQPEKVEWIPGALFVNVPMFTYSTLYTKFGDGLIVGASLFFILLSFLSLCMNKRD